MKTSKLSIIVIVVALLMLAAGVAGAIPSQDPISPTAVISTTDVSNSISYQGFLRDSGGAPLNGNYTMRFIVYDDQVAGSALWDSGNLNITAQNGLFNVQLGVDQADFNGQALWLTIIVGGQTLSPRQEILPAPYALSLRPGAEIVGDSIAAADAALSTYTPATGTAFFADANGGTGIFGDSEGSYGVQGSSNDSWGGYFTSEGGYGLRVNSNGIAHYDHGAYITSNRGYAVYAQSATNQGVRGEAGNVSGIVSPLGPIGVVGLGQNRGVVGSSLTGAGVYASSSSNYGVWGTSTSYRGVTGRTGNGLNNYGFYTPDNLYALNYNIAGSIMQVMQNNGPVSLAPGDVVVFNGINQVQTAVDVPIVQVSKVGVANSTAVAGVVYSRFNIDAVDPALDSPEGVAAQGAAAMEVTPAGNAAPGEYVLIVVQGAAQVNVSALGRGNNIQPGDLLSTNGTAGLAGKAEMVNVGGIETAVPGTVFGKALESLDGKQEMIYVYVTLQ